MELIHEETYTQHDSSESQLLRRAIELARKGDRSSARGLLVDICRRNNGSELGWFWLASFARTPKEGLACVKQVLRINPSNKLAREWVSRLSVSADGLPRPKSAPIPDAKAAEEQSDCQPVQDKVDIPEEAPQADTMSAGACEATVQSRMDPAHTVAIEAVAEESPGTETPAEPAIPAAIATEVPSISLGEPAAAPLLLAAPVIEILALDPVEELPIPGAPAETAFPAESATEAPSIRLSEPAALPHFLPAPAVVTPHAAAGNTNPAPFLPLTLVPVSGVPHQTPPPEVVEVAAPACPICESPLAKPDRCQNCKSSIWPEKPIEFIVNRFVDHEMLFAFVERMREEPAAAKTELRIALACCNLHDFTGARRHLERAALMDFALVSEILGRAAAFLQRPIVLVVDDSATIREVLVRLLNNDGFLPVPIGNAWEVLPAVKSQKPEAVLLDVTMPMMDGYEVCRQIRADRETRATPVVMLSGNDDLIDKVVGKLAGASDYLNKPFKPEQLLRVVKGHVFRKR